MRLPRRVPWASLAELDQVCSWIYADENDLDAKVLAINRLAAWKATTTIPHALESALSILTVIVQDASAQGSSSFLSLRQAYAAAIIRLVNGLVDPLQLGAYARSIASIAAQLGLPAWLVELRHAATHEDLPSIDVLREAARDSMSWLLHHYFIPALNPSNIEPSKAPKLRPLYPVLAQYKSLLKSTNRDASLRTKYKQEITKVLRDIERWISEAKLASDITSAALDLDDTQADDDIDDVDPREWSALNRLCDHLLEKGGLVPVSKKKRSPSNTFDPSSSLLAIWSPLLTHIHAHHPSFPSILISRLITVIIPPDQDSPSHPPVETISLNVEDDSNTRDLSYELCIASWAHWMVESFVCSSGEEEEDRRSRRANAVASLVSGIGMAKKSNETDHRAAQHLLKVLCAKDPNMQQASHLLLQPITSSTPSWTASDLTTMSERLDTLLAASESRSTPEDQSTTITTITTTELELPKGWKLLDSVRDGWRPTPIGVSCFS
ncbi:Las1-domain-containing protein [Irpex rosettiformis]|uniref:Las1-domain-containing protein n=1 Tax=Irpex rosettiformis TaxID=378272 RepID=A0ACB8TUS1_9APHY|nr:Las1-domain-containing protein [Irpex rosettiformis]